MSRNYAQVKKRPKYWLRRLTALLLLLSPFLFWYGYRHLPGLFTLRAEGSAPRVAETDPVYILLLGVDERKEDVGRSDTVILVRLGRDPERVDLVSIPRDTRIVLDGERAKLNSAYSTGGAEQVVDSVAELLDIPRPYYMKVNLQAFEQVVDHLGGVELTVDRDYHYEDPYQDLVINIRAGRQVMDGETALKFVRLRYDGAANDDISRIKRQQQFMKAVAAKFADPSSWPRIPSLISTMKNHLATNLPEDDQLPLASAFFAARGSLKMITLPGVPEDTSGDWLLNDAKWTEVKSTWQPN